MSDLPPPPPPPHGFTPPPPGYVAYGGPGSVVQGVQSIAGIAKAMQIMLVIMVPLFIVGIFDTMKQVDDAKKFLAGDISEDTFLNSSRGVSSLVGVLMLPVAILTMIWMFRMAKNIRVLGRSGATWAPGWGIGGWFVPPLMVYVVPWLMFRELWKGSDPDVPAHDPDWKRAKVSPIVDVWWVLYGLVPILSVMTSIGMLGNITNMNSSDLAKRLDDFSTITIALAVLNVVNAVVYLVLVRNLSERHIRATSPR